MSSTQVTTPQRTALYECHLESKAKMVDFAGWEMPIEYSGIKKEHEAVRTGAGLFDLSHMGECWVWGEGALEWLQSLFTNDLSKIEVGKAQYGCMCNEQGRVLDDMIIYRFGSRGPSGGSATPPENTEFWMVVMNASNREKIVNWMSKHKPARVEMDDASLRTSLIAIQGPKAQEILQKHVDIDLEKVPYYGFLEGKVDGLAGIISRTGYTGEDGFELYLPWNEAAGVWRALVQQAEPIGLGARDTLRLESGYALYGHELSENITPLDASLGWVTKLDKGDFIGREAIKAYKEKGVERCLVGLEMEGRAIPREGYPLHAGGKQVGVVTSGTFSPSLKRGIALGSVETALRAVGTEIEVEIRGRNERAKVTRLPFVKGSVKRG